MKTLIIHTKDIFPYLELELTATKNQLIIVSAFVKIDALKRIDHFLNDTIEKILLVRFRKTDLLAKVTDIDLFDYCQKNGWKMFFNLDLHSKIFVFDKQRYFVGSSNVTLSGLGIAESPNIESGVSGILEQDDYLRILNFFEISELMTSNIMNQFQKQLDQSENTDSLSNTSEWNLDNLNLLKKDSPKKLWVLDFPSSVSSFDIRSTDLKLLGLTRTESYDEDLLREKFIHSKCYQWFINAFDREIYFGELTAKLHGALIDDPAPYRKDVKDLLSIMLNWINELKIEGIIIDRPNYSQRIRKTN